MEWVLKVLKSQLVSLDADLTVTEMHRLFISENLDLKLAAYYWVYNDMLNYEIIISFGFPRSDICDTCERLTMQIKAAAAKGNDVEAWDCSVGKNMNMNISKTDKFNV